MSDLVFAAIAEPRRRAILRAIDGRELTAGQIGARFDVTRPAISQHLAVLRGAGLVAERRDGTRRWYRARPEGLAPVLAFIDGFWAERLETLRTAIEEEQPDV